MDQVKQASRHVEKSLSFLVSSSTTDVIVALVFFNSIAQSIWVFNAWSPFVYTLFGQSNLDVGLMSAVNGVFEFFAALLAGYLGDHVLGPSRTLQIAIGFGVLAAAVAILGVWSEWWWLLVATQAFEGTYMGFSFTSVESVFAQCIPKGSRDLLYARKYSLEAAGPIVGIVMSIILFSLLGNTWRVDVLRWVITAGVTLHASSLVLFAYRFIPVPSRIEVLRNSQVAAAVEAAQLASFNNSFALGRCREAAVGAVALAVVPGELRDKRLDTLLPVEDIRALVEEEPQLMSRLSGLQPPAAPCTVVAVAGPMKGGLGDRSPVSPPATPLEDPPHCSPALIGSAQPHEIGVVADIDGDELFKEFVAETNKKSCVPIKRFPLVVALSDIVTILGSGMTTQYFPLFMMALYGVSPIEISALGLANSVLISVLAVVVGWGGRRYGRTRAILVPKMLGALILLYMALAKETPYGPLWLMAIAYVVRGAVMNCSAGVSRALLMDIVKEGDHGKWNAVESMQSASWSGSAVLGGYFADHLGYGAAFIFTFFFHLTACGVLATAVDVNDSILQFAKKLEARRKLHEAAEVTEAEKAVDVPAPPIHAMQALPHTDSVITLD